MYRVFLASRILCKYLKKKLSNFLWIERTSKKVKRAIIKGLFDAEGTINIENKIEIANSNPKVRELSMKLLSFIEIPSREIGKEKTKIRILGGIKSKIKFLNEIGVTIPRKRERLEKHLNYWKRRAEAYKIAIKLREKRFTLKEIKDKLNSQGYDIPKGTLENWIYYKRSKPLGL